MKKRMAIVLLLLTMALSGCGAQQVSAGLAEGKLLVCASFSTMADFTGKVAGDRAEVRTLVPAGAEAHDWEPTPQDILLLEQADMLVVSGAGFEHWTDGVLPTLRNKDLVVVVASEGLELLEGTDHGDHRHEVDPHVWLDPMNAKAQMDSIAQALSELDPEGEDVYRDNYQQYAAACDALDETYRAALEELPGRVIVVAHEAYGYLCHRYGLQQVAVEGLSPEGEPDPAKMAEVVSFAEENGVRVIFFEEMASPKVAQAIAREIGAETAVLSPIEGLTEEQQTAGADYFSIMEENLEQLKAALQ